MVQAAGKLSTTEQHFTHSALTWGEFKILQTVVAPWGRSGVLLREQISSNCPKRLATKLGFTAIGDRRNPRI